MGATSAQQQSTQPTVTKPTPETSEIAFLSGYKTYLVAFIMVVYAASGYYLKDLSSTQAWMIIFNAAGITGLRSGIESIKNI